MRLSLSFGADNCVRLRCHTEPRPNNRGDNPQSKRNERDYKNNAELQLSLSRLRSMDEMNVDRLDLYDTTKSQSSVIFRAEVIQDVNRIMSLVGGGDWVPFGLSPLPNYQQVLAALDLLNESQQLSKPARWGHEHQPTKLTARAKLALREAGSILDRDYKNKVYLVTLTLPSDGRAQFQALARYSGYLINRVQRELRRIPQIQYYYVWEFQKRGALHLHYAIAHHDAHIAFKAARVLRAQFYKVLRDIGRYESIDMFASRSAPNGTWANTPKKWQWKIDKITKSVTGYLSKYLSKGSLGFTEAFYPARWWGCCTSLRDKIKESKFEIKLQGIPNAIARSAYYHFVGFFSDLCPGFSLNFENHIHNSYLSTDVDGFDVRLPSSSLLMSIWGSNFYFNPAKWHDISTDLRAYFSLESNPFLNQTYQFAADNDLIICYDND